MKNNQLENINTPVKVTDRSKVVNLYKRDKESIEKIMRRLKPEIIKTMKKINPEHFFGWKEERYI